MPGSLPGRRARRGGQVRCLAFRMAHVAASKVVTLEVTPAALQSSIFSIRVPSICLQPYSRGEANALAISNPRH